MREVKLRGRVGAEPLISYTPAGTAVLKFPVAGNEKRPGGKGEDMVEETHWFNVNVWGKQAEWMKDVVKKGALVRVDGKLESRAWKDKNGTPHKSVEVSAHLCDVIQPRDAAPSVGSNHEGLDL
jgi:single-strand DNA-binding protein